MKKSFRIILAMILAIAAIFVFTACDNTPGPTPDTRTALKKTKIQRDNADTLQFSWLPVDNASSYDFFFVMGEKVLFSDNIPHKDGEKKYEAIVNPTLMNSVGDYFAYVTAKANPDLYLFSTSESVKISILQGSLKDAPVEIFTVDDFKKINDNPMSYHYKLMADLDFGGAMLNPIGYKSSDGYFKGSLNGNNHTLKNFQIQSKDMDANSLVPTIGLFKYLQGAEIYDLTIYDARSDSHEGATPANENVGILAGVAQDSIIRNVQVGGTINWRTPHTNIKGGHKLEPTINMGGLIGEVYNNNIIENCSFNGTIQVESPFDPNIFVNTETPEFLPSISNFRVGGLIGYADLDSKAKNDLILDKCYFKGSITIMGHNIYSGGFIGEIVSKKGTDRENGKAVRISNCYAEAKMNVNAEPPYGNAPQDDDSYDKRIGLFIGKSDFMDLKNCYANTSVSTNIIFPSLLGITNADITFTRTIGFVGYNRGEPLTPGVIPRQLIGCYYNGTINNNPLLTEAITSIGGWPLPIIIKDNLMYEFNTKKITDTAKLYKKETYENWDFDNIWQENADGMPTLKK